MGALGTQREQMLMGTTGDSLHPFPAKPAAPPRELSSEDHPLHLQGVTWTRVCFGFVSAEIAKEMGSNWKVHQWGIKKKETTAYQEQVHGAGRVFMTITETFY